MMFKGNRMKQYLRQQDRLAKLVVLIAETMQMPEEDDKVQDLAMKIYVQFYGKLIVWGQK